LAALVGFRHIADGSNWVDRAGGAVLVLAGGLPVHPLEGVLPAACRTPLTFLATHNFGAGVVGAFRVGVAHGFYCLGCCWH